MGELQKRLYDLREKVLRARGAAVECPTQPVFMGLDADEALILWKCVNDFINKAGPVESNLFDESEKHDNCTVEIWRNSLTGEESVGWWENES